MAIDPHTETKSHYYIFVACVAAFAGILFGYDTGVISVAIVMLSHQFQFTPKAEGLAVSAVLIGAFLGALCSGRLADQYGRKKMLMIDAIIFMIGTIGSCFSNGLTGFVINRIIVGIAIGISSYVSPLYISEISPVTYRGALVSLNQLAIMVGISLSYIVGYYFSNHGGWRWMFGVGVIPAVFLFIGMIILPDSPRWVFSQGRYDEALHILEKIYGKTKAVMDEFNDIKEGLKITAGSWSLLFSRTVFPTLVIGAGLSLIQQVTGINTILYYATSLFIMAGFTSPNAAIFANMMVGGVLVLFTIISLCLIDTIGRRPLLLIGLIFMAISLLGLSYAFSLENTDPTLMSRLSLISMLVYVAAFSISLGPIMWLMISEIFPLKVRGRGSSLATCVNWASNGIVAYSFPLLLAHIGKSNTFMIYFVLSIASIAFVYWLVPETKGVTLEKIEENLYAGKKSRYLGEQ